MQNEYVSISTVRGRGRDRGERHRPSIPTCSLKVVTVAFPCSTSPPDGSGSGDHQSSSPCSPYRPVGNEDQRRTVDTFRSAVDLIYVYDNPVTTCRKCRMNIFTHIFSDREKEEKDIVLPFSSVPNG